MQKMTKTVVKDETADKRLCILYKCFFLKKSLRTAQLQTLTYDLKNQQLF